MKCSSFARRNRSTENAAVVAMVAALATAIVPLPSAYGGEDLTLEDLVSRSSGAVQVQVKLGARPTIEVTKVLKGEFGDIKATPDWFGLCLPPAMVLRKWVIQYAAWPAKAHWRNALRRGGYSAVVFLGREPNGPLPECGVEAMQMRHTNLHPDFEKYVAEVKAALGVQ